MAAIAQALGYDEKLLKRFVKKLHKTAKKSFYDFIPQIGGEGIIVEVDESKFGKRKYHRGHRVDGVWVLGLVERTTARKMILIPVIKRDSATLTSLIFQYVKPGSIIFSDGWKGYN